MGYGFHPLGAWLANTAESLAMLLRPGNAGSNTFTDHLAVLTAAIRQIPSLPVPAAGPRRRGRCQPRADQPPAVAVVLARPQGMPGATTIRRRTTNQTSWLKTGTP
jgi:hypothetical protein